MPAALFSSAMLAAYALRRGYEPDPGPRTSSSEASSPLSSARAQGEEIRLYYLGSSRCRWSNLPETRDALRSIIASVRDSAEHRGVILKTIGIALDRDAKDGTKHLLKMSDFDEISSGGDWLNFAAAPLFFGAHAGPMMTPQIVIMRVASPSNQRDSVHAKSGNDERVLARLAGLREIRAWIASGSALESAGERSPAKQ